MVVDIATLPSRSVVKPATHGGLPRRSATTTLRRCSANTREGLDESQRLPQRPSEAAQRLTTGMFAASDADATIGAAEALRRSMLELIQDDETMYAHPMFWAPFMVVGEGARL